ncbi:MAG: type 1 glutamine amidotransferase [Haloarculaceae archaeon]
MSRTRLALLDASHEGSQTRRNFRRELDADLVEFGCQSGDLPETFAFDGAVVTGSRASVYWDEPWIAETKAWVADAVDAGLPFLGVCWGHQLLADVLGGEVEHMGEYEIGYRTVRQAADTRLFDGIDEAFTVFVTHQDRVTELPPGATKIAANEYGVHGFRKGRVFAVQFHPEYDTETAETVASGKDLPDPKMRRVLDGITEENYRASCEAKRLFDNFLEYVDETSADVPANRGTSAAADD